MSASGFLEHVFRPEQLGGLTLAGSLYSKQETGGLIRIMLSEVIMDFVK